MKRDETGLIDMGDYPHIHAAGVAEAYRMEDGRVRFVMFDWFKVDNIWRRMVTGLVDRPFATLRDEQSRFWREGFFLADPAQPIALQ